MTDNMYAKDKTLYNEGRVVGLSAYELYVREHIAQNPEIPPASEIEWLASSIAFGSSMLLYVSPLKVDQNRKHREHYREFALPSTSRLGAANTIIASWFLGKGTKGEDAEKGTGGINGGTSYWATAVTDFGPLISNNSKSSPNGHVGNTEGAIPTQSTQQWGYMDELDDDQRAELKDYIKLADGIVLTPGTWSRNPYGSEPAKDLKVDMKEAPRIRIYFADEIEHGFWILLSGFTLRAVLSGCTGIESALGGTRPQDGDFLGPPIHPWSAKVVFTMPSAAAYYLIRTNYFRTIQRGTNAEIYDQTAEVELIHQAVVDMETVDPKTYYNDHQRDALVPLTVDRFDTMMEGLAVLTIYQKKSKYPPAIWGTKVDEEGRLTLAPIDIVSDGSIKMFGDSATAQTLIEYETTYPGTTAMKKDKDGQIWILNENNEMVPAAEVSLTSLTHNLTSGWSIAQLLGGSTKNAQGVITRTGKNCSLTLSMSDKLFQNKDSITQYNVDGSSAVLQSNSPVFTVDDVTHDPKHGDTVNWAILLTALANNGSIDLLGILRLIKYSLPYNYIQFPSPNTNTSNSGRGIRLYISNEEVKEDPSNPIPIGSIGIGW